MIAKNFKAASARVAILWTMVSLTALVACEKKAVDERPEVARPVKLLTVGEDAGKGTLELPGSVFAAQSAELSFEVDGRMTERLVEEGQLVTKGDVVARVDPRDYIAQRDSARAKRDTAEADFDRYAEAFKSNAVTEQQVSRAKGEFDISQADLDVAEKALADTNLVAPFSGRVARRLVDDFANVRQKEPVILLQDESSFELRINVAERDWARGSGDSTREEMTENLQPRIELASIRNRTFKAWVKEASSAADPVTRTYQVTLGFEKPAGVNVSPGMTGKVIVDTYTENLASAAAGITVPANAVVADESGSPYVWVIDTTSMRARPQPVDVGEMHGASIAIRSGLDLGDVVAVGGVNSLTDGMLVRAMNAL